MKAVRSYESRTEQLIAADSRLSIALMNLVLALAADARR